MNRPMILAALGVAIFYNGVAWAADTLPIEKGIYVTNAPCGKASFGNIAGYKGGSTLMVGHSECAFRIVAKSGATHRLALSCSDLRADKPMQMFWTFTVPDRTTFRIVSELGDSSYRFCPTSSLPDPWGSRRR